jgi:hypothetical protein
MSLRRCSPVLFLRATIAFSCAVSNIGVFPTVSGHVRVSGGIGPGYRVRGPYMSPASRTTDSDAEQ